MSENTKIVLLTTLLTVLCVLGARTALSDDFLIRGGAAIQNGEVNGGSKIFGLRYETPLISGIEMAGELGGYVDNLGNGRKGAALAKLQLGIVPGQQQGLFGVAFTGPCLITTRDSYSGSFFQFASDFGVGIRDSETLLTLTYTHISNAGLAMPNHGRDFIVMGAGLRW